MVEHLYSFGFVPPNKNPILFTAWSYDKRISLYGVVANLLMTSESVEIFSLSLKLILLVLVYIYIYIYLFFLKILIILSS